LPGIFLLLIDSQILSKAQN